MLRPDRETRLDWAAVLRSYREERGMMRATLARTTGASIRELSAIESGYLSLPRTRAKIGEALGEADMVLTAGEAADYRRATIAARRRQNTRGATFG